MEGKGLSVAPKVARKAALIYLISMSIKELKEAIIELPERERLELSAWLSDLDDDAWDRQMKQDALPGGKLHSLPSEAHEEYLRGGTLPFPKRAD